MCLEPLHIRVPVHLELREHVVKQMQRMIVRQPPVKMEACVSINYTTTAACVRQDIQEQHVPVRPANAMNNHVIVWALWNV